MSKEGESRQNAKDANTKDLDNTSLRSVVAPKTGGLGGAISAASRDLHPNETRKELGPSTTTSLQTSVCLDGRAG